MFSEYSLDNTAMLVGDASYVHSASKFSSIGNLNLLDHPAHLLRPFSAELDDKGT